MKGTSGVPQGGQIWFTPFTPFIHQLQSLIFLSGQHNHQTQVLDMALPLDIQAYMLRISQLSFMHLETERQGLTNLKITLIEISQLFDEELQVYLEEPSALLQDLSYWADRQEEEL